MRSFLLVCTLVFASGGFAFGATQADVLIYGQGDTQISSELDAYQDMKEGVPLSGSVFVTHDIKDVVDVKSFTMGGKPLKVEFVRTVSMSSYGGNPELSIYSFKLEGLKAGEYTLPPIVVKVGSKKFQAPPLIVEIGPGSY